MFHKTATKWDVQGYNNKGDKMTEGTVIIVFVFVCLILAVIFYTLVVEGD